MTHCNFGEKQSSIVNKNLKFDWVKCALHECIKLTLSFDEFSEQEVIIKQARHEKGKEEAEANE